MKVVLLAPTPPPAGGIAGWTVRMKEANLKNGWEVKVVDEKLIGGREVFGQKNKKNIYIEIKRTLSIWNRLIKALKDNEVKVVHSCIPAGIGGMLREYICALITKCFKKSFVIHYRCTLSNMVKSKKSIYLFKILTNISDIAIVLNSESKAFIEKYSNTKSIIIPNFIEKNSIKDSKIINDKITRILYVGGVTETKGCCDIIKVAKDFPRIQFRLVGKVEKKIIDMDKTSNVVLLGEKNKTEVKKELEKADIFMFLSYFEGEGFSNALAEAMSNGLPCIVTDWAANKDMIENCGGIVVDLKCTNQVKEAIKKLNCDKVLRKTQSNWNINKVKTCYTDKTVTDMYVDIYEECLIKRKRKVIKYGKV